jgi:hypothetical protein
MNRKAGHDVRHISGESICCQRAVDNLAAEPRTSKQLGRFESRSPSSKRIENHVPGIGRQLDAPGRDKWLQLIDTPPRLELRVTCRSGVVPNVRQVQTKRVEIFSMSAVILHVTAAMTANWNGQANFVPIERCRHPLREVEECVVSRVKLLASWESPLHRNGDPVAEKHPLGFEV